MKTSILFFIYIFLSFLSALVAQPNLDPSAPGQKLFNLLCQNRHSISLPVRAEHEKHILEEFEKNLHTPEASTWINNVYQERDNLPESSLLLHAMAENYPQIVQKLLDHGADIFRVFGSYRYSAFQCAFLNKNIEISNLIFKKLTEQYQTATTDDEKNTIINNTKQALISFFKKDRIPLVLHLRSRDSRDAFLLNLRAFLKQAQAAMGQAAVLNILFDTNGHIQAFTVDNDVRLLFQQIHNGTISGEIGPYYMIYFKKYFFDTVHAFQNECEQAISTQTPIHLSSLDSYSGRKRPRSSLDIDAFDDEDTPLSKIHRSDGPTDSLVARTPTLNECPLTPAVGEAGNGAEISAAYEELKKRSDDFLKRLDLLMIDTMNTAADSESFDETAKNNFMEELSIIERDFPSVHLKNTSLWNFVGESIFFMSKNWIKHHKFILIKDTFYEWLKRYNHSLFLYLERISTANNQQRNASLVKQLFNFLSNIGENEQEMLGLLAEIDENSINHKYKKCTYSTESTFLMEAIAHDYPTIVQALIKRGANIFMETNNYTPFGCVLLKNNLNILQAIFDEINRQYQEASDQGKNVIREKISKCFKIFFNRQTIQGKYLNAINAHTANNFKKNIDRFLQAASSMGMDEDEILNIFKNDSDNRIKVFAYSTNDSRASTFANIVTYKKALQKILEEKYNITLEADINPTRQIQTNVAPSLPVNQSLDDPLTPITEETVLKTLIELLDAVMESAIYSRSFEQNESEKKQFATKFCQIMKSIRAFYINNQNTEDHTFTPSYIQQVMIRRISEWTLHKDFPNIENTFWRILSTYPNLYNYLSQTRRARSGEVPIVDALLAQYNPEARTPALNECPLTPALGDYTDVPTPAADEQQITGEVPLVDALLAQYNPHAPTPSRNQTQTFNAPTPALDQDFADHQPRGAELITGRPMSSSSSSSSSGGSVSSWM